MEKTGLWLTDWGLTALSGQIGYIFAKYVAVKKSEINEKIDNVTCLEYIQYWTFINNVLIWSL